MTRLQWLGLIAVVGCAQPTMSQSAATTIAGTVKSEFQRQFRTISVHDLLALVRKEIGKASGRDADVFVEELPQGLRAFSGVPCRDSKWLRNGILTVSTFVSDALDADHDVAELRRVAEKLTGISTQGAEPSDPLVIERWPKTVHTDLLRRIEKEPTAPVTVVGVSLPYTLNEEVRVRSIGLYWSDGWIGYDVVDTGMDGHALGHEVAGSVGLGVSHASFVLFGILDAPFREPVPIGLRALVNGPLSIAVHTALAVKESAFEGVKGILAPFASLIAVDPDWEMRMWESFLQPYASYDDIWRYHAGVVIDSGTDHTPLKNIDTLLQIVPIVGNYMPHYFDDTWTQFSEAPPLRNFTSEPREATSRHDAETVHVFLTRGVHGRGAEEQGNALWQAAIADSLDEPALLSIGFTTSDCPKLVVTDVPYEWGTFLDPVFSLLNLSSGYAYTLAQGAWNHVESVRDSEEDPPIVSFVAHSGGVQRATVASRLLWSRDVFTDTIYGVAGPATIYAPTKPEQNRIVLSKSEYQDADFTSGVSSMIADFEALILKLFELPLVGLMWEFSLWSRGYAASYANADILRIEGRKSTLHRNPGKTTADRRDLSLTFFRDDLTAILAEKLMLRAGTRAGRE